MLHPHSCKQAPLMGFTGSFKKIPESKSGGSGEKRKWTAGERGVSEGSGVYKYDRNTLWTCMNIS